MSHAFQDHFAAVIKLLMAAKIDKADTLGIFMYTAAMNCQKMKRRLTNASYSRPYILSLTQATFLTTTRPFPGPPTDPQLIARDAVFLHSFLTLADSNFLDLASPPGHPPLKFPHLIAMASSLPKQPHVYTPETSHEIQHLLVFLLHYNELFLTRLCKKFVDTPLTDQNINTFDATITNLSICGLVLCNLAYSSFPEEHFHRLNLSHPKTPTTPPDNKTKEDDPDLTAVQPNSQLLSVVAGTAAWLRLQTTYWEAATTLIGFFTTFSHAKISAAILVMPHPGTALHPDLDSIIAESMPPLPDDADPIAAFNKLLTQPASSIVFEGTLHCEAILAAAIEYFSPEFLHNIVCIFTNTCR